VGRKCCVRISCAAFCGLAPELRICHGCPAFVVTRIVYRAWQIIRTRVLWGWRFHELGARSILGRSRLVPNPATVSVGDFTAIMDDWTLADLDPSTRVERPKIRIGSYCTILHDFQCNANVAVEVQDYVLVGPRVFISDSDHVVGEQEKTTLCKELRSAPVVIEHNCWLGVNAVVLKGVRIGHHSIVGANAVVTRDVPPFSTVVGIPARPLAGKVSK
jgi:acetyltransferase-like isoleucine patch superfamily enzyme